MWISPLIYVVCVAALCFFMRSHYLQNTLCFSDNDCIITTTSKCMGEIVEASLQHIWELSS